MRKMLNLVNVLALALGLMALVPIASAQTYPSRPIRLIVPLPPGGAADGVARVMAEKLSERLGQPVVVDNRAGAAGIIGTDLAAKSTPDGYTLLLGNAGTHAINPSMYNKLPYDPVADFEPISQLVVIPLVLVVSADAPAKSIKELIALAKSNPGKLNFGSAGIGGATHIAGEVLNSLAGVDIKHIPFKGGPQMNVAVLSGEILFAFPSILEVVPLIKAGRLIPLGVTPRKRVSNYMEIPTIAEAGVPGYESGSWNGLFAPRGTPQAIVTRLNAEVLHILAQPDVKAKFVALGTEPVGNSPSEFAAIQKAEIARYAKVLQDAGVQKQ